MVKGIDIVHTVCNATQTVLKLTGASANQGASAGTQFQELAGRIPITNGRASINNTLLLKSPLLRVQGQGGAIDLGANRLDSVSFVVKPSFTCEGQGGKELQELKGVPIPIRVKGSFAEPTYRVDLNEVLKGKAEAEIKRQRRKLEEKLDEKLKGLFN